MMALRKFQHTGNSLNLPARMAIAVAGERFLYGTTKRRTRTRKTRSTTTSLTTSDNCDSNEESWPSIQTAKEMATCHRQMDNTTLVTLAALGVHKARVEVLVRHIMAVDEVPYQKAQSTLITIKKVNHEGMYLLGLPFQIAVASSLGAGLASIPMVFHLPTVEYVNQFYVTVEEPPLTDLETWLEVGSWSWMWMEPLLGVATFSLLCLQYLRMHLNNLGFKPYTHRLKRFRGERLAKAFPKYDRRLLIQFSETATIYDEQSSPGRQAMRPVTPVNCIHEADCQDRAKQ